MSHLGYFVHWEFRSSVQVALVPPKIRDMFTNEPYVNEGVTAVDYELLKLVLVPTCRNDRPVEGNRVDECTELGA